MKIERALQLLVLWEEISATVPEGSEDREHQRRAVDQMVAEATALQDRSARESKALLRELRAVMDELPDYEWPPLSGPGVERECTLELATSTAGPCIECVEDVGSGIVGWIGAPEPGPLCDRCLGKASPQLAAMPGLLSCLWQITEAELEDDDDAAFELAESLLTLTQVWASSCAGAWPARPQGMRAERDKALALMRQRHGQDWAWASQPPDDEEAQ